MGLAWRYLEQLCQFPHRGSATRAEATAAAALSQWLAEMGYQPETQAFRAPRDTLYLGPVVVMASFLVAAKIGLTWPAVGILLCLAFLAPLLGEMLGSARFDMDRLLPLYPSQNVVARLTPAGPVDQTLVLVGHYDTQRASYLFHPAFAPYIQWYFYLVYTTMAWIPLLLALRWALPAATWVGWGLAIVSGLLGLHLLFLLLCRVRGRPINGANDNGTGAALVLALAEHFALHPLPGVAMIFLLTGAEEVGTRGMKAFMRTAALDPGSTRFINLDNIGGGRLHYLTGEGMLAVRPYGADLVGLAQAMAAEQPERLSPKPNLLLPTDGSVPMLAGYQAISFLAFGAYGSLPNYHWYTDTLDRVDGDLLAKAEAFLVEYIHRVVTLPGTST